MAKVAVQMAECLRALPASVPVPQAPQERGSPLSAPPPVRQRDGEDEPIRGVNKAPLEI